ncbi:MAG: MoaD/ThiS family protein [Deltaproteobacteria bacterium]|nr:MoaD/ThiS family protein [Deltaproteobacteria bacterium]
MKIMVKSFFPVLRGGRPVAKSLELPEGAIAGDVLKELGIGDDVELIILINERPSNENASLADDDVFTIMPPVSAA